MVSSGKNSNLAYGRLAEFRRDALRPLSWSYLGWQLLLLALSVVVYILFHSMAIQSIVPSVAVFSLIAGSHLAVRLGRGGLGSALAPDILFLLLFALFQVGYIALFGIGIVPYVKDIIVFESSIPKALLVVNLGLVSYLVGFEFMGMFARPRDAGHPVRRPTNTWNAFGVFLMGLGLGVHLVGLVSVGPALLARHGYAAIQNASQMVGFWTGVALSYGTSVCLFGLVLCAIASSLRNGKVLASHISIGFMVALLVILILEGDRGPILKIAIPVIFVRHLFVKRIKTQSFVALLIGMFVLFASMGVVRSVVFDPTRMLTELKREQKSGRLAWYTPLVEMGGSFNALSVTCHDIPLQEPYWMGKSWLSAAAHVVPFLQGYMTGQGWLRESPSQWLTYTYWGRHASGRAFTLAAEGYLNFGYAGTVVELLAMGCFMRWLVIQFSRRPSATRGLIFLGCLGPSILVIRSHLNLFIAPVVFIMIGAVLLDWMLGHESGPRFRRTTGSHPPAASLPRPVMLSR